MAFRINSRNYFLTYPKCDATKEEIKDFIESIKPVKYIIVAREKHEDGSNHIHAQVTFENKFDCKNEHTFDFKEYHPNIQACKNVGASRQYCKKEGDYLETSNNESDINLYALARELSFEDFMETCRKENVSAMYATTAWKYCENQRHGPETIFTDNPGGTIREDLAALQIRGGDTVISIIGPSGIGKTTWALRNASKPSLFCTHLDDLKKLSIDHESIIFDDMSFKHMPRDAQIQLLDTHCTRRVHVRYGTVQIPAGIQKIFLSNVEIFDVLDEAINRRIKRFYF